MNQSTLSTLSNHSRLVDLLAELSDTKLNSNDYNFAERLSQIFAVSGSINLAQTLRQLPVSVGAPANTNIQDEVFGARARMMKVISDGFVNDLSDVQMKVPTAVASMRTDMLQTFEPYQRFYNAHQIEIAANVQRLKLIVRKGISGISTELHQLAELDKALDDALSAHTRKLFSVVPKVLEQRFKTLLKEHLSNKSNKKSNNDETHVEEVPAQWLETGAWLNLFYKDMREILLAELDVRLQPVLGLLEALNEHEEKQYD